MHNQARQYRYEGDENGSHGNFLLYPKLVFVVNGIYLQNLQAICTTI
jgi:hypothetical protein